jgi:hypothetical protein
VGRRQAELEQDLAELVGLRALRHRALEVADRRRRIPERLGAAGGSAKSGSRPVALAGVAHQQVRRHRHRVRVALGEHASCPLVRARALDGGQVVLDRGAQDRMREAQMRRAGHEARALELGERLGGRVLRDAREGGDIPQRHVVLAEDRERPRHGPTGARQPL